MSNPSRLTFFAGVNSGREITPEHISVDQALQLELTELFQKQATEFLSDEVETVDYNAKENYRLEREQVYVLRDIALPVPFLEAGLKPYQTNSFTLNGNNCPRIATIFGTEVFGKKVRRVLFQQFRAPQLLHRKLALFFDAGTFNRISHDGLSLANELAAIWQDDSLYFRSFSAVARFFGLEQFEPKASVAEIREFIGHEQFHFDDKNSEAAVFQIIENDDYLRRRVASIVSSAALNLIKPVTAKKKASVFGIEIDIRRPSGKSLIALPTTKKELKSVVRFLNEEYFHGELTDRMYEANSLRQHRIDSPP
jgi:hypothetical protein